MKTILLVEDNCMLAKMESLILEKEGYGVIHCKNGETVLEKIIRESRCDEINLTLMDIDLGSGISGIETARIFLKYCNTPLMFLSSHCMEEVEDEIRNIDFCKYLQKGCSDFIFLETVKEFLL